MEPKKSPAGNFRGLLQRTIVSSDIVYFDGNCNDFRINNNVSFSTFSTVVFGKNIFYQMVLYYTPKREQVVEDEVEL